MEDHNPAIRLFQLIKNNSDEHTAHEAILGIQGLVKGEVKAEIINPVYTLEVKLVERTNHVEVRLEEKINGVELRLGERINRLEVKLGEFKAEMIDRINISKNQTIFWIVSVGILQLVVRYLFKE